MSLSVFSSNYHTAAALDRSSLWDQVLAFHLVSFGLGLVLVLVWGCLFVCLFHGGFVVVVVIIVAVGYFCFDVKIIWLENTIHSVKIVNRGLQMGITNSNKI